MLEKLKDLEYLSRKLEYTCITQYFKEKSWYKILL